MPMPRLAKYPRIRLFEYALSAATRAGKRLGRPRPLRLMAPLSIKSSNTVESWASPGVSSNTTVLPLPSQRTCSLVENPPLLRPNASLGGSASETRPLFLLRLRAGERARRSYQYGGFPMLPGLWRRHLFAHGRVFGPTRLLHAIGRSGKRLFYRSHSVPVGLPRALLFSLSIVCR